MVIETKVVIGCFKLQNFKCDWLILTKLWMWWLIELPHNKVSDNKLSDDKLTSELVGNMNFLSESQSRKL